MKVSILILILLFSVNACKQKGFELPVNNAIELKAPPNIILLYVDDLGYADVGCYGAKGVNTPNIDAMAANGVRFTDAHSATATCTPSRYSLLTGNYAFRKKAKVLKGDAPLLIDTVSITLPKMLKKAGYTTAVIGKWHLGLGDGYVDWNKKINPGPKQIGFDYSFLLPATGDRVPTVYMENGEVIGKSIEDPILVNYDKKVGNRPTGDQNPEQLRFKADPQHSNTIINGVSRIGYMQGGKAAEWVDEDIPYKLTLKATKFIQNNRKNLSFYIIPFTIFMCQDYHIKNLKEKVLWGLEVMLLLK
ncbi:sulfatase-like hydrolase/transferase [Aquimarina agarilytica]|uniref:sulfatase-like hydrolase/transferase n=1 Tax=Aquimarina agarilytica TaxID=1087449 RepID=UPI0002E56793|nr:sulfatase-like hydrolase/transferase [Aquimarina agarilytica]